MADRYLPGVVSRWLRFRLFVHHITFTALLSIAAFSMSAYNFYVTQIYARDDLQVMPLTFFPRNPISQNAYELRIAIVNSGTQDELLFTAEPQAWDGAAWHFAGNMLGAIAGNDTVPVLIKPHEFKTLVIGLHRDKVYLGSVFGLSTDSISASGRKYRVVFPLGKVDANGHLLLVRQPVQLLQNGVQTPRDDGFSEVSFDSR